MSDLSSQLPEKQSGVSYAVLRLLLPAIVLLVAAAAAWWLLQTGPKAKPRPKVRSATLVEVRPVEFSSQAAWVNAMGRVMPSRTVTLRAQVGGEVLGLNRRFIPGGRLGKGEVLLEIDSADYRLEVIQRQSELARAEAELDLERGNQLVAQKELALLGEQVSADQQALMLRKPQYASLRAAVDAARARLEQAQLDQARATVKVPFNATVLSRDVELGSRVSSSTDLARLAGTDRYWVEALIPVSQLPWVVLPDGRGQPGSHVRVYDPAAWGEADFRKGEVISLAAGLEEQGRMAQLLIAVDDPLALEENNSGRKPALLVDSYVRLEIEGRQVANVAAVDRQLVRDGALWIMDTENRLDIRPVDVIFRGRDQLLVANGLSSGELLVVSALATPVQGMPLRLAETVPAAADKALSKDLP